MEKIEIKVPKEVEYISDWKDFNLPLGHSIIDKTICGCGFTEFCLRNQQPLILCSPRKVLLSNKMEQHVNEPNMFYFRDDTEGVNNYDEDRSDNTASENIPIISDKSICGDTKKSKEEDEKTATDYKNELSDWLKWCSQEKIINPKILVTYDSLHHVLDVLGGIKDNFYIVVDEMQAIFSDAVFKADTELSFVDEAKECKNVLYLSATPELEKYLNLMDYFKDLPMYKLVWDPSKVESVRIERRYVRSITKELKKIIGDYKSGNFPTKILSDKSVFKSTELVIFVNSVKTICNLVKQNGLKPEETNIICSKTDSNYSRVKKAVNQIIGDPPTKGKPHKMFTFCTRTSYLGADFYSPSAYTIVCSDCTVDSLVVDIQLDLPQIIGRQRLKENRFRNEVLMLVKSGKSRTSEILNLTEEEHEQILQEQHERTNELLKGFESMSDMQKQLWAEKAANDKNLYDKDFLGVSKKTGKVEYNKLVLIAKRRAYDVSRKEYQDNITIKRSIESIDSYNLEVVDETVFDELNNVCREFLKKYESTNIFSQRLRYFCQYMKDYPQLLEFPIVVASVERTYFNYYHLLGPGKLGTLGYREGDITKYIMTQEANKSIKAEDLETVFTIGKRYTSAEAKSILQEFYDSRGMSKIAKATDLEQYFKLKDVLMTDKSTGKKCRGIELEKRK